MRSDKAAKLLPVMAVAFVVSAAFACMAADSSDADFIDFEEGAYIKVSGTYDQVSSLVGTTQLFLNGSPDSGFLEDALISGIAYNNDSSVCTYEMTAGDTSLERSIYKSLQGDTYTEIMAEKITMKDVVITRTLTEDVDEIISTYSACDGLGELSKYIGTSLKSGDTIKCTISELTYILKAPLDDKIDFGSKTWEKSGTGYLLSGAASYIAMEVKATLVYTVTSGSAEKTFTIDVDASMSGSSSIGITYSESDPQEDGGKVLVTPALNNLSYSGGITISFDGKSYTLEDLGKEADIAKAQSKAASQWSDYSSSYYTTSLPSDVKFEYKELLAGLTGSDEDSEKAVTDLGGTLSRSVDDAKKLADSIGSEESSGSSNTMLYVGIAVAAILVVAVVAFLIWRSKNPKKDTGL